MTTERPGDDALRSALVGRLRDDADFRRYFRRGIGIVAAGYLLNVIMLPRPPVPPEERLWHGGVLQTIGLTIILLGPLVPLLRRRWARWAQSWDSWSASAASTLRRTPPNTSSSQLASKPTLSWLPSTIVSVTITAPAPDGRSLFFLELTAQGIDIRRAEATTVS